MRAAVTPVKIEKNKTRQQENRRRGAAAAPTGAAMSPGKGRRLGRYEALLLDQGEAEVVASIEALLRAVADRLAAKGARRTGRKR